jgi:hypothetical protein
MKLNFPFKNDLGMKPFFRDEFNLNHTLIYALDMTPTPHPTSNVLNIPELEA